MKKIIIISMMAIIGSIFLIGCQSEEKQVKNTPKLELGTPFEVNTENGDYDLTIDSIKTTEKRNYYSDEKPKQVVVVEYTYKNKNFVGANGERLLIDNNSFIIMDGDGNVLRVYPLQEYNSQEVPKGAKCTSSIAYAVPTDSNTIKIQFIRGQNETVAEMVYKIK